MSCFCKGVVALAQGERTARLEMASGLSQCSKLSSLLQMTVVEVACLCVTWCKWVTAWTRYCPLLSSVVDVRWIAQFGVGVPTCSISSSLAHVTLCQCLLSGLSVSSLHLLSLNLSARISSREGGVWTFRCLCVWHLCSGQLSGQLVSHLCRFDCFIGP